MIFTQLNYLSCFFFLCVYLPSFLSHAQDEINVLSSDHVLSTQAEVDAFNCTTAANVTINADSSGDDPIINLDSLCILKKIEGELLINDEGSTLLNSLEGLHNLKKIGGDFISNGGLSFEGMDNLISIGGQFEVNNGRMTNFKGLEKLSTVGDLSIRDSDLESFQGLSSLKDIEGNFILNTTFNTTNFIGLENLQHINGTFALIDAKINSFEGLGKLKSLGEFTFSQVFDLNDFTGLEALKTITGDFQIPGDETGFTSLKGLESLETVEGEINIYYGNIQNLEGLSSLKNAGKISINATAFTSLEGIGKVKVEGDFNINSNANLTHIMALANVQSIDGDLVISDNTKLSECCVIPDLNDVVQGEVNIYDNAKGCNSLEDIEESCEDEGPIVDCQQDVVLTTQAEVDAFDCTSVENLTIDASVNTIDPVDPITNLQALSTLENVEQNLNIISSGQSVLTSLEGLNNLKIIGGDFTYSANQTKLQGMSGLEEIGGDFEVYQAGSLVNFEGLENLKTIQGGLSVTETSIKNFIGLSNLTYVGGVLQLEYISTTDQISFEGLSALESVGGIVFFSTYVSAEDFTGLESLKLIDGDIDITGTDVYLQSFDGLERVEEITGDLRLSFKLNFGGFQGLSGLKRIGGDLYLSTNSFESLDGLEQLEEIGGALFVNGNGITDISGLHSLASAGEVLLDEPLSSLEGLEQLRQVNGDFKLISTNINALDPFQKIETIAGDLVLRGNSNLSDCCIISDLLDRVQGEVVANNNAPGCNSLEDITTSCDDSPVTCGTDVFLSTQAEVDAFACEDFQNLTINLDAQIADPITDLTPLRSIEQIQGDLTILLQGSTLSAEGLDNISSIGGSLFIQNGQINNFNLLNSLSNIGGQFSFTETSIDSFDGLSQLTEIGSFSFIDGEMGDFTGLSNLQIIHGGFTLINIDGFQNFQGLENLNSSGGFNIQQILNVNFNGLSSIETIGGLIINNISSLNFEGLESLQTIGGPTNIRNSNFNDFTGLNNLEEISGRLGVFFNNLQSFEGLNKLSTIGESLLVRDNPNLTTLSGLENVSFIESLISINRNNNLSACCIIPSLIEAVQSGDYNISENAPNCSSLEVIEENCEDEGGDENARSVTEIKAYPNPVMNAVQIHSENSVSIRLYNNNGHLMKEQLIEKEGYIDMIALPAGVYLLEADGKVVNRIIKK